jgi:integrase
MRVALLARVKVPQATGPTLFKFESIVTERKGKPLPDVQITAPLNATTFYLRFTENGKRTTQSVGVVLPDAITALRNKQLAREYVKHGQNVPTTLTDAGGRKTVGDAVAEFVAEQKALDKSDATVYGYTRAVEQFRDSCRKTYLDEVNRADVVAHIQWLRDTLPSRKSGQRNGMVRTRLQFLSVFFLRNGIDNPLPKKEWPKVEERDVEAFTTEEVNTILSKATDDEADLIQFLLFTGFRDNEAAHTFYSDVDFKRGAINVSNKPDLGFTIKNRKQRKSDITLPSEFVARLKARKARLEVKDDAVLIFPNSDGRPDNALLARVRKAAKRAGYKKTFGLHKFRKTFGTLYGERFGIVNAQHLLGHADIRTTQKYLARTVIAKADVENLFAGVGK